MSDQNNRNKKLVFDVKHMIGDLVNIRVFGDWMFSGVLTRVEDNIAFLTDVTVFASGGLTLSTFEVGNIRVNLDALTSIAKPVES